MLITLQVKGTEDRREFEKAHALRILRLPNSAYEIAKDSNYEFIGNEIRRKQDTEDSGGTTTKRTSTRGKKSRK
jgi:hypothetical protein